MKSKFGVLSDIHGNVWALEAVLADAERRGVKRFLSLGDSLNGPLEPQRTAELLIGLPIKEIRGNGCRTLLETPIERMNATFKYVYQNLSDKSLSWLKSFPSTASIDDFFLCHGTPASDMVCLIEKPTKDGSVLNEPSVIANELTKVSEKVILCGHSHIPRTIYLPDGRLVVNPGSIGLPAYTEEEPFFNIKENGSPHARYAIITKLEEDWIVESIAVAYDWSKAANSARKNGRDDWAKWIESGRAL